MNTYPRQFGSYTPPLGQYRGMTRFSAYIPMRDGVRLAVDVTLPKNLPRDAKIPALLSQSRYWRQMELYPPLSWITQPEQLNPNFKGFKPFFTSQGYALVDVDVRGTGASFGTWPYPWHEDSVLDAREILDWIVSQPWSNGKIGGHGISYLGTTAELLTGLGHPAVKAVIPMFNHPDPYLDIAFPGGVFNERFITGWGEMDSQLDKNRIPKEFGFIGNLAVRGVKPVDEDRQRVLLQEAVREHASNYTLYQTAKSLDYRDQRHPTLQACLDDIGLGRYLGEERSSGIPIFNWGSWMDGGTGDAALRRFLTLPSARQGVIGAWDHGGDSHASPYRSTKLPPEPRLPAQWAEMGRFFDRFLKDDGGGDQDEEVLYYFTVGEEKWKQTKSWPPAGTQVERWYLAPERKLHPEQGSQAGGSDNFQVDFNASTGLQNRWWELGPAFKQSVAYPRRTEAEKHMLCYYSPTLTADLEITGYPVVKLFCSSSDADGAVFVYLEDVHPNGEVTYLTEGILRLVHRKISAEKPPYNLQIPYHTYRQADRLPIVPGEVMELHFGLQPISAFVRRGDRLRLGIAGHDKDTFVRLPAVGNPNLRVFWGGQNASYIDLPIVKSR